jgi:hypothetical protein
LHPRLNTLSPSGNGRFEISVDFRRVAPSFT